MGALPVALVVSSCGGSSPDTASSPGTSTSSSASAGSSTTADPAASQASTAGLTDVKVAPGTGTAAPTITLGKTPFTVPGPRHRVVRPGTGATITAQDKVIAKYLLVNGRDGKPRATMWTGKEVTLPMEQIPQFAPLVGQKVGTQMLLALPAAEAVGPQGDAKLDVKADDTLLYLLEAVSASAPLTQAQGTPVPPKAGLPTVTMGKTPKDPATFTLPKGNPPTTTVAQPLIVGKGPRVTSGQTVRVSYTGVTWREPNSPFDYSGKTPEGYAEFPVGTGSLIKAWDENLVGQTVGTRLLLIVPPADGYGAKGSGDKIRGTDTLVFVLDILDAS